MRRRLLFRYNQRGSAKPSLSRKKEKPDRSRSDRDLSGLNSSQFLAPLTLQKISARNGRVIKLVFIDIHPERQHVDLLGIHSMGHDVWVFILTSRTIS